MTAAIANHAHTVARSLGLPVDRDPLETVVDFCENTVRTFYEALPCDTLEELLELVANRVSTRIRVVTTDDELRALIEEYVSRGEARFALLESDLSPDVFGQTLRVQHRRPGELQFVSVVDARGPKAYRQYFTAWHETAHLLSLPSGSARDSFQRSHSGTKHPEEQLMDAIAARVAFFRPILVPTLPEQFSFESVESLRTTLCPTASAEAMLRAVHGAWSTPALFVRAERGFKKAAQVSSDQRPLLMLAPILGDLRAVSVTRNAAARASSLNIHKNMRVPEGSVITTVFKTGIASTATEDLATWSSSDGKRLPARQVAVFARQRGDGVDAMLIS